MATMHNYMTIFIPFVKYTEVHSWSGASWNCMANRDVHAIDRVLGILFFGFTKGHGGSWVPIGCHRDNNQITREGFHELHGTA